MMNKSSFNPHFQEEDISSKIVASLERISNVYKSLLWEKAKIVGLSPIQIQLLIFIAYHKAELCNITHLAKEFNVSKPTISDAVKVLNEKKIITKDYSSTDNRSYTIFLSPLGKDIVKQTDDFADPIKKQIESFPKSELEDSFKTLSELIYKLTQNGIISIQRSCYGCQYYSKRKDTDYCNLLDKKLSNKEIRIDCPEYKEK